MIQKCHRLKDWFALFWSRGFVGPDCESCPRLDHGTQTWQILNHLLAKWQENKCIVFSMEKSSLWAVKEGNWWLSSVLHLLQVRHFIYSLSALEGDHYHPQYLVGAQGSGFWVLFYRHESPWKGIELVWKDDSNHPGKGCARGKWQEVGTLSTQENSPEPQA